VRTRGETNGNNSKRMLGEIEENEESRARLRVGRNLLTATALQ
jgi:hypothetical protein